MSKLFVGILIFFLPVLAFAQASAISSRYQPATVTQVKPHQSGGTSTPGEVVYEVSVRVNGTTYVILTKLPPGEPTFLYSIGRELLVRVDENTITWNDILGQSHEVPIISRGSSADSSKSQTD
jgi:hypothetical protein